MNALEELQLYIEQRGEQIIPNGNGMYKPDTELLEIMERFEREWIERPKDANGTTRFVGDEVECFAILADGERSETRCRGKIDNMTLCADGGWLLFVENGDEAEDGTPCDEPWCPENVAHVKPDSWEQIEEDAREWYPADYWHRRGKQTNDRITMSRDMRIDIVRRCKALAGEAE